MTVITCIGQNILSPPTSVFLESITSDNTDPTVVKELDLTQFTSETQGVSMHIFQKKLNRKKLCMEETHRIYFSAWQEMFKSNQIYQTYSLVTYYKNKII